MTSSPDPSQTELAADNAPGGTLAIETHGLSKHFGQRKAVDGLTISIPAGTIAGFVVVSAVVFRRQDINA